jgi:hypothetical protein
VHRQLVTRTQYLAKLNKRLREHPAYVEGMAFVVSGDLEKSVAFDWVPGGKKPPAPFAEIALEVHALYRVLDL